jgi:uroporphyrinogen decarboxylase
VTGRERICAAFDHRELDRVPIDFSGHRSSGISAIAYARLRDYLGLEKKPVRVYDPIQQLAIVHDDVLDLFGVDTIELGRAFATEDECWSDWVLPDGTPCQMPIWVAVEREADRWIIRSKSGRIIAQMPDGALYFEQAFYPFENRTADSCELSEALEESMWHVVASPPGPLAEGERGLRALAREAKRLREKTNRAILALFGGNLLESGQMLFRNDRFLMLLASEPAEAHAFLDRLVELHLAELERFLSAAGPHIDVIVFGDDLGMQTGPQISPSMYREFFKPRHRVLWQRSKQLSGAKVMLHCCGGVRELLPDLIDAGLDAINPVQISCRGMDAGLLKAEFGTDIVFWGGGADTRMFLPHGTPEQVRRHVQEQVALLEPGGGFVFQQVHNVLADVPPANVGAMFEAVLSRPRRFAS